MNIDSSQANLKAFIQHYGTTQNEMLTFYFIKFNINLSNKDVRL